MKKILAFAAVLLIVSASVFAGGSKEIQKKEAEKKEVEKYSPGPDGKYSIVGNTYLNQEGTWIHTFDETNFSTEYKGKGWKISGTYELSNIKYFTNGDGTFERGIITFYTDRGITKMEYELTNKWIEIINPGLTEDFVWETRKPSSGKIRLGYNYLVSD